MELNLSRLAGDVGVGQQTARRWLNVLEIGYLAVTLPPHYANFRKRLRKRHRLHFLDTGLVCYLLDIPDAHTLARHPLRGAIHVTRDYAAVRTVQEQVERILEEWELVGTRAR